MQKILIVLLALSFTSAGGCGSPGHNSPRNVDLNAKGSMEALARDNPDHHAKITRILVEVQRQKPDSVPSWMKTEFGADQVQYTPSLFYTSLPAKRYLTFTLDKTRYEVLLD